MTQSALEQVTLEVGAIFYPLRQLDSAERITAFFKDLGYELPSGQLFSTLPELVQSVEGLVSGIEELAGAGSDEEKFQAVAALLVAVAEVAAAITEAVDTIKTAAAAIPNFVANSEIDELPRRLMDYLLCSYLFHNRRAAYGVLFFIGVVDEIEMAADAARFQPAFTLHKVWWERLPAYFTEPQNLPEILYQWNTGFDHDLFLKRMYILLSGLRLPGGLYPQSTLVRNALGNTSEDLQELRMPIFERATWPDVYSQFGINISSVEAKGGDKAGFALIPYVLGEGNFDFNLSEKFEILFEISASIDAGIGAIFKPDKPVKLITNLFTAPLDAVSFGLELEIRQREDTGEIALVGEPGATRLAIEGPGGKVFLTKVEEVDAGFELKVDALRLVISGGDGDGFIAQIIGDGITAEAGFSLLVSRQKGVVFGGSGGLELHMPTHISLGPLEIKAIILALKFKDANFVLETGANFKLELGPLVGVVENIGLKTTLSFPPGGGNLGPANLAFDFKPPNGVGLAINAGVVSGGGYLYFDFDKEEYAGVLELDLSGILSVKAIGLITTRMPDGSKGFSLLLIITAEFGSPIQLGFGFTLNAVGGLLGLHRTMRLDAIASGIRDGGINSIMFPQNVIANATRILSDLQNYFPVNEGTFLIGPMVKIGWGTGGLVTVAMGIIIEIPGNIAILGVLKVALPHEEGALIIIQVNFIGAIEFDKSRLWFFAALYESRVLFITLEGEMGLLVGWGDDPSFVVSVGGFHPAFNPPPLPFGAIARIAISILNTDFARIRVEGYFAVTANSVQFGAAVELFFGVSAFNIDGHLAFDALFRFSPFYFIITISASLSVKVFGIGLFSVRFRGSLEGPTPWHVEGSASISLLFFDIDVDFSHTWGNEAETTLPPITVLPLLVDEFEKVENWRAKLPENNRLLVTLRNIESTASTLILHPVGSLQISQRAVPLGITIDKVGNQKPSDANRFEITVNTTGIGWKADLEEPFAVGQFLAKSDDELLSAKSFEPMKSGVELSVTGEQYHAPVAVKRVVRYEKIILDTHFRRFMLKFFTWTGSLFALFLNGNAAAKSVLSNKHKRELDPFGDRVEVGKVLYTVALVSDNTAFNAQSMDFTSQAQAQDHLRQQVAANANLKNQIHVIPQAEMQRAE